MYPICAGEGPHGDAELLRAAAGKGLRLAAAAADAGAGPHRQAGAARGAGARGRREAVRHTASWGTVYSATSCRRNWQHYRNAHLLVRGDTAPEEPLGSHCCADTREQQVHVGTPRLWSTAMGNTAHGMPQTYRALA